MSSRSKELVIAQTPSGVWIMGHWVGGFADRMKIRRPLLFKYEKNIALKGIGVVFSQLDPVVSPEEIYVDAAIYYNPNDVMMDEYHSAEEKYYGRNLNL